MIGKNLLFAFGVAGVAAIAGIAAASGGWLFWDTLKGSDREAFRALIGAFSGAFFAFLFVRFGEGLKRIYDRKEKHHTTLVRLTHYFNDCLNITGDNVYVANTALSVFSEETLASGELPVFFNEFHSYPIDRELVIGLTNMDFANEVYTLNVELRKLNDSMATTDRSYAEVKAAFISKQIDPKTYVANVRHGRPRYIELREFLLELKADLIRHMASANLLARDAPFLVRVIRGLTRSTYSKRFTQQRQTEARRIEAEIEALAEASRVRIDAVSARAAQPHAAADAPKAARR